MSAPEKPGVWRANKSTSTVLSNAYTYYNTTNQGSQYTPAQSGTKVTYYGVKGSILETDKVLLKKANSTDTTGNKFASVTSDIATAANWKTGSTYEELLTLTPNTITKLRIYFWVEGQDIDCENSASGGEITLKLQFSLNDAPAATTSPTPTP